MQKLISVGASLNDVSREGRGALHCSRSRMCTELLINEGADVNLKDHSGMTPLHSAITRSPTIDCSLALIKAGADENARCQRGETPLIKAARNGNLQIIELLLEKGANVNAFDLLGRNALYHAIFRGKTMRLLLNEESDANAALRGATDREYKKCVKPLLKAGAHVNSSPQILIVSASRGDDGCLKLLFEAGADVNLCSDSDTALHYAAKEGHASCTDLLLRAGADVNALGTDMKSPLMVAAVNNRPDSVKLLLQAGAKVRITEKFGGSTLQRYGVEHVGQEQSQGYKEMVRLLYAAGERKEGMSQRLLHKLIGSDRRQLISILNADPIPSNIDQLSEIVIQHLQDDDQTLCLKDICRRAIREHLLQMSGVNLFVQVPHLGLPPSLARYLLYDISLN